MAPSIQTVRRSASASASAAAKRAAAEDLTGDSDDNAKRHKANGAPIEVAAAPAASAASVPVAAAADSSGSSAAAAAAPPSPHRAESAPAAPACPAAAAAAAPAAAVPLPSDTPACSICFEAFPSLEECKEEGGVGRVPRALACPKLHTYCTKCLEGMVKREKDKDGKDRVFVVCACTFQHELRIPQRSASSSAAAAAGAPPAPPTNAELVRLIPVNALMMESISQRRQLEQMVHEQQLQLQGRGGGAHCRYPDCAQPAILWCQLCGHEMCAVHDLVLHPAASASSASPSSLVHRRTPLSERSAALQSKLASGLDVSGAKLRDQLLKRSSTMDEWVLHTEAQLQRETERYERLAKPLRHQIEQFKKRRAAIAAAVADSSQLSNLQMFENRVRLTSPLVGQDFSILAYISHRMPILLYWLRDVATKGIRSNPLYSSSRDGFKQDDFARKCAGRSGTITLVSGNGYVFGAYTHCAWPAGNGIAADPTGKSFLFSLINATGKPVRFSLRHLDSAVQLSAKGGGVHFGAASADANGALRTHPSFGLMWGGRAGDQPDGNTANSFHTLLSSYKPDDPTVHCGAADFFAGHHEFGATDINVFEIAR